jgi:Spy/CpxP family protein refolding chaperone
MKKIIFVGVLVLSYTFAFSQSRCENSKNHDKKEEKVIEMRDKMAKELNLTDDQIKRINLIEDKYKSQEDDLRKKSEELRKQIHKLKNDKKSEINTVFTEEQRQKIKKIKEDMHNKRNIYRHGTNGHNK